MNYFHLFLIILIGGGFQGTTSAPTEERQKLFANLDYDQVVSHMKELMMYLPVLMTTVKETMTGFPKINEGLNSIQGKRFLLGSGRNNDGKCRCKQVTGDTRSEESGYQ